MACELLITRNKRRFSDLKKGCVVSIKDLPHNGWGSEELYNAGLFGIVRVIDTDSDKLKFLIDSECNTNGEFVKIRKKKIKSTVFDTYLDYNEKNEIKEITYDELIEHIEDIV